jgi:hypothetical protein
VATAFIDAMLPSCQLTSTTVSIPAAISSLHTSVSSASKVSRRSVTVPGWPAWIGVTPYGENGA